MSPLYLATLKVALHREIPAATFGEVRFYNFGRSIFVELKCDGKGYCIQRTLPAPIDEIIAQVQALIWQEKTAL